MKGLLKYATSSPSTQKSHSNPIATKPLHLGLFRSDYLLHSPSNEPLSIKQVEFNTISVSFGSLSQRTAELHRSAAVQHVTLSFCSSFSFLRYLLEATQYYNSSHYLRPENFPANSSIAGLAEGLAKAHEAYNVEGYMCLCLSAVTVLLTSS